MELKFADRIGSLQASAIREILKSTADPNVISFAAGNPAPEAFPVKEITEISNRILTQNPISALQYSISEGYTPLRDTLKSYLKQTQHIGSETDDLIIVSGAQQGIELSCKVLCNEGDTIICENPSFVGSLNAFKSYNANLVGIDMDAEGIEPEKLEAALKSNPNTKFIYLIPNFQNPSGKTMSFERRKAVYALAKKYSVLIIEDNPYGDLRFSGEDIPTIKSLDIEGLVIYCGSFSKILSPGMRVGHVTAHKDIIQKIVVVKQVSDVHTNIWSQIICNEFMTKYDLSQHIASLKQIYKHKCNLMLDGIREHFSPKIEHTTPEGGLFLWCTLPEGSGMMEFCRKAVSIQVAVVPGTAFLPSEEYRTTSFRLNFSTPTDEQIIKGIELLGKLTKEMF
ncbi:MAG: Transcriptional regulator containing a DNA-binding domain and an aminotransferase domain [Oscillospiraceae bacterium]|jgi:2-aminoadipate transaminase|nr:Transcriptional regulator containing a DNA-binding domain and an aminotransferase domain [Oscillospiraceae bacterium]